MEQADYKIQKISYTTPYIVAYDEFNSRKITATDENTVTANIITYESYYGDEKVEFTYTKTFDSNVKSVKTILYAGFVLLENGDLWMCGTDKTRFDVVYNREQRSEYTPYMGDFVKIMSGVKEIRNDYRMYDGNPDGTQHGIDNIYALKNDGTVWVNGCNMGDANIAQSDPGNWEENRTFFAVSLAHLKLEGRYPVSATLGFQQIPNFNNITRIEVRNGLVLGMTTDHRFFTAGQSPQLVGGFYRSGKNRHPTSSVGKIIMDNATTAIEVTCLAGYDFTDIAADKYGIYYVSKNKGLYRVTASTAGWEWVWSEKARNYFVTEPPFTFEVNLLRQYPQDFVSLVKSQDPYYDHSYNIYDEANQEYLFYSYFNGTKILSKKGIKYLNTIDEGDDDVDYHTYTYIKAPPEDAPWVESYNEVDRKNLPCRNIEVIDINDAINSTYRTGSNRYFVYLAKGDSFKSATEQITDFIKANDFNVYVSCDPNFLDKMSGLSTQTLTLNQLLTAKPNGKKYGLNALESILTDISNLNSIQRAPDGGLYLVYGEDTITYDKFYRDFEGDPKLSDQSKAIHEKDYFENSMGLSAYHNKVLSVPLTTFDKVGKFTIEYEVTDKPSTDARFMNYNRTSDPDTLKVYVHRRPIADFDITYNYRATNIGITLNDLSYDLDHSSMANKGITKWDWAYKVNAETTWHTGKPTNVNYKDVLEIALTVTDVEGASSKTVQRAYTMPESLPLTLSSTLVTERAEFTLSNIPASETLKLTDIKVNTLLSHGIEVLLKSSDGILKYTCAIYNNNQISAYTETNGERHWRDISIEIPKIYKDGDYQIEIVLKDLKKGTGDNYPVLSTDQVTNIHRFKVKTPVKIIGELTNNSGRDFELKGITGRYSEDTLVKLFYGTTYEKNITLPLTAQSAKTNHLQDNKTWQRNTLADPAVPAGQYTARFETNTASGNKAIAEITYDYRPVEVKYFDAKGYWNHWRGQTTLKGEVTTIEPHRFLSHECVIFEALIKGEIEGALLRLSPELESMTFWDKYNNVYRYEDDFHMRVYFPVRLKRMKKAEEGDLWQFEYALPYANSTQSFENERLKPSYKATLYVFPKGTPLGDYTAKNVIKMEIDDIDITGNIYDLLYIEPVRGNVD